MVDLCLSENILEIGNKNLDKVTFLGMIIYNKLNWEPHVVYLTKKLNSSIVLKKLFQNLNI